MVLNFSEPENFKVSKIENTMFQSINLTQHTTHQYPEATSDKGYLVKWPANDEAFIFSEQGLHLETRTLFTDSILLQFTHDNQKR